MSAKLMSGLSLDQFPVDILLGVFGYLDIPDILRLRRVSRYLNEVSHRRDVWTDVYRNADFVHPPGPFHSQSAHDLENALIPSFRVHWNLQHLGGMAHKLREIRYPGVELDARLVFGRFLLIALGEEIRYYDLNLDSNLGATTIYRPTSGTILKSFHCVSAIDAEGRSFACVVLSEVAHDKKQTRISLYSLNVAKQSDLTLELLHQFEHSQFINLSVQLGPRVIVVSGSVGNGLDSAWHVIALDVHTRTQFALELSSFTFAGCETDEASETVTRLTSISTSTHLLLARSLFIPGTGQCTSFQAFTLPSPSSHECFIPLSSSHRGIIPGINPNDVVLLHDTMLDPSTRDIIITVRVLVFEPSRPYIPLSKYGILRLSKSDSDVGTIAFELLGSLAQSSRPPLFHPSFNCTGRAFYTYEADMFRTLAALEYDVRSNDGIDDEPGGKVIEYPSVTRFMNPCWVSDYDPYSGRICVQHDLYMETYRVIDILDLGL